MQLTNSVGYDNGEDGQQGDVEERTKGDLFSGIRRDDEAQEAQTREEKTGQNEVEDVIQLSAPDFQIEGEVDVRENAAGIEF